MSVTDICTNLLATDRMLTRLRTDKHFGVQSLDDSEAIIPIITWLLLARALDKTGKFQIFKGPHYQYNSGKISDAMKLQKGRFCRIAGQIIYASFSKDLEFDETKQYKIDINNGEIYVYPAIIDSVEFSI